MFSENDSPEVDCVFLWLGTQGKSIFSLFFLKAAGFISPPDDLLSGLTDSLLATDVYSFTPGPFPCEFFPGKSKVLLQFPREGAGGSFTPPPFWVSRTSFSEEKEPLEFFDLESLSVLLELWARWFWLWWLLMFWLLRLRSLGLALKGFFFCLPLFKLWLVSPSSLTTYSS